MACFLFFDPLNLVRNERNRLLFAVHTVEIRRLIFRGIVDDRVSVPVVMRFGERVLAIRALILALFARRPKDGTVQKFCVLRRVGKTRDIKASAFSKRIRRHLHFADVYLSRESIREYDIQHVRAVERKNIFLVFAVIDGALNPV